MNQALPPLYDHQEDHKNRLRSALGKHAAAILCANPGVGKTRMAKWIMGASLNRTPGSKQTGHSLFAVHRRSLVDNASQSFTEEPALDHGVIMSGSDTNWRHPVQVASIDTMLSWYVEDGEYQSDHTFDLVCFDECHSHFSKLQKWLEPQNKKRSDLGLDPTYVIGLSATPEAKGLADVFGEIVLGPTTEWLIDNNYLSPFRYFQATQGDLGKLVKRGNEFTNASVDDAMKGLSGDLLRDWRRFGEGRPTVGFFNRLSHAREACDVLIEAGIAAEYVDCDTPDDQRNRMFADLGSGRIQYLCNVGIVERGTNIPAISCIQLCTAVGSVVRYRQMIGRGSRTCDGKTECVVIDHGGNVKRNGFFEDEVEWILDNERSAVSEHAAKAVIACPKCQANYRGGRCFACGYEPTPAEFKSQGMEFNGAEMKEITRGEKTDTAAKTCEQLMVSALYMAGRARQPKTWKQAIGIAYALAKKQKTTFKVPRSVNVAGFEYQMPHYGSEDCGRFVKHLFPFAGPRQ